MLDEMKQIDNGIKHIHKSPHNLCLSGKLQTNTKQKQNNNNNDNN